MPERVSKDGNRVTITQFEVRELNADGDAIDVSHYETKTEALAAALRLIESGSLAVGVEKHVSRHPAHLAAEPDTYTTLAVFGDRDALEAGGWEIDG